MQKDTRWKYDRSSEEEAANQLGLKSAPFSHRSGLGKRRERQHSREAQKFERVTARGVDPHIITMVVGLLGCCRLIACWLVGWLVGWLDVVVLVLLLAPPQ